MDCRVTPLRGGPAMTRSGPRHRPRPLGAILRGERLDLVPVLRRHVEIVPAVEQPRLRAGSMRERHHVVAGLDGLLLEIDLGAAGLLDGGQQLLDVLFATRSPPPGRCSPHCRRRCRRSWSRPRSGCRSRPARRPRPRARSRRRNSCRPISTLAPLRAGSLSGKSGRGLPLASKRRSRNSASPSPSARDTFR